MSETRQGQKIEKAMGDQALAQIATASFGRAIPGYVAPLVTLTKDVVTLGADPRVREAASVIGHEIMNVNPQGVSGAVVPLGIVVAEHFPLPVVANRILGAAIKVAAVSSGMACFAATAGNLPIHGAILAGTGPFAPIVEVLFVGGAALGCLAAAEKGSEILGQLTVLPVKQSVASKLAQGLH